MISRRRLIKLSAASTIAAPTIISSAAWSQPLAGPTVRSASSFRSRPAAAPTPSRGSSRIKMSEVLGQQFYVESKPGAGGNIASEFVARSDRTATRCSWPAITTPPTTSLNPKSHYDASKDFEPISLIVQYPIVMAIPTNSPDKTLADFIARAKAEPGKITYGSPGHGAVPHLSAELFVRARQGQDGQRALSRRRAGHSGPHPGPHRFILEQHRADGCRSSRTASCACWG